MINENVSETTKDHSAGYKTRLGVWMFLAYSVVYAGFVLINVAAPSVMSGIAALGLNLATVYGFGLIIFALLLALIYNSRCSAKERQDEPDPSDPERGK